MANIEKYNAAFIEVFGVTEEVLNESFSKENTEEWDSVHQLNIISILEESFDIMFEPEEIMELIPMVRALKFWVDMALTYILKLYYAIKKIFMGNSC
jgi:acyl carrier protein